MNARALAGLAAWPACFLALAGALATAPARAPLAADERVARAAAALQLGRPDAALDDLAVVLEADPRHARAHFVAGLVAMREARQEAARAHLLTYLRLAPAGPDARTAREALGRLPAPGGRR